jgi:hypothetical protein
MRKLILSLTILIFSTKLFSFDFKTIEAKYDVTFGIIGRVGSVDCKIDLKAKGYKIEVVAKKRGIVKLFTKDSIESYESVGEVRDGRLIPLKFTKLKKWSDNNLREIYIFDYENRKILKRTTLVDGGKVDEKVEFLSYFSDNDILTLFFNLKNIIGKEFDTKKIDIKAVGASKKDGVVTIETLKGQKKREVKKLLGVDNHLLSVTLHRKIFSSKKGEFYIDIGKNDICDRAVLKDVLLYGDIVGKLKNLKVDR